MEFEKLPLHKRLDWINIFYLSATPIGTAILLPVYLMKFGWQWPMWVFFVISYFATNLAITGGYHRLFAHRSYDAQRWIKIMYLLIGAGAFQGSAVKWATDHRRHHRQVDTPEDPYNINQGFWWAHIGWLLYRDHPKYRGVFAPDLAQDRWVMFQHHYYLPLALVMAFGVPTLIGYFLGSALGGLVLGGGLRLVMTNHATFFINSLCHMVGKQPYTDRNSARDSFVMAFFAAGEGYHNYHHAFQTDYRNGIRWYHWDPTKWMVRGMSYFGWTFKLREASTSQILAARLGMDEKAMVSRGIPADRLAAFRQKVEEAQSKVRWLKEEYRRKKTNMQEQSRRHLDQLRLEIKIARREFREAWSQWAAYKRGLQPVPA